MDRRRGWGEGVGLQRSGRDQGNMRTGLSPKTRGLWRHRTTQWGGNFNYTVIKEMHTHATATSSLSFLLRTKLTFSTEVKVNIQFGNGKGKWCQYDTARPSDGRTFRLQGGRHCGQCSFHRGDVAPVLLALRESVDLLVPTLAPQADYKSREVHVPEDILHVIPRPKSKDGDTHRVRNRGAFAAMAGAAVSVRIVVTLKVATASSASAATSTAASSTGLRDLFCHRQLDTHQLGPNRGRETGRRMPHVMLLDEVSEGGVQGRWDMVGEEPELVKEVNGGDGGEGSRLG